MLTVTMDISPVLLPPTVSTQLVKLALVRELTATNHIVSDLTRMIHLITLSIKFECLHSPPFLVRPSQSCNSKKAAAIHAKRDPADRQKISKQGRGRQSKTLICQTTQPKMAYISKVAELGGPQKSPVGNLSLTLKRPGIDAMLQKGQVEGARCGRRTLSAYTEKMMI